MRYFVVRCNHCGHYRAISTSQIHSFSFKCFLCGKTNKLKHLKYAGLNVKAKEVKSITEASHLTLKANETKSETSEFHTYSKK